MLDLDETLLTNLGLLDKKTITSEYYLPAYLLARVPQARQAQFAGNIVILTRSLTFVEFVEPRFAFNSSLNSIYFRKNIDGNSLSELDIRFLKSLARYLNSKFVRYCFTLFWRMWALDERRVEMRDLMKIPMPVSFADIGTADDLLQLPAGDFEEHLLRSFDLSPTYRRAIQEFLEFRSGFQNGQVAEGAKEAPTEDDVDVYRATLQEQLWAYIGRRHSFSVRLQRDNGRELAVLGAWFKPKEEASAGGQAVDWETWATEVLHRYDEQGSNMFADSLDLSYDPLTLRVALVKPLVKSHWTVERSIADSERVLDRILARGSETVAA